MKILACVLLVSCAIARAQCTSSTSGNVTLQRCMANDGDASGSPQWHFFVTSSDPATRGFRLTLVAASGPGATDAQQGYTVTQVTPRPKATVHFACPVLLAQDFTVVGVLPPPYIAPLVSIKVEELQPASSTAFSAADGSLP